MNTTLTNEYVMTQLSDIKKNDFLLFKKGQKEITVKVTNIEFISGNAHFQVLDLETLDKKSFGFIDGKTEVKKLIGYEHVEQISLKCDNCNKLLGKATFKGTIEIKCNKCKTVNTFSN